MVKVTIALKLERLILNIVTYAILVDNVSSSFLRQSVWVWSGKFSVCSASQDADSSWVLKSLVECLVTVGRRNDCDMVCYITSFHLCVQADSVLTSSSNSTGSDCACFERLPLPSASPTTGVVTYEDPCLALPGFSWSNGLCVRLYLTFYDPTNDTCTAHGAHLFDMFGEQDSESLDKLFSSFSGTVPSFVLLGAKKTGDSFLWTDGTVVDSGFWGQFQPVSYNDLETCVAIQSSFMMLYIVQCDVYGFVCQLDV